MIDTGPSGVKRDDEWHAKQDIIRDGNPELEAKIAKRLKRSPIPFNVLQERLDMDAAVLSALLKRLGADGVAEIEYGFGWKLKAPRPKMTKAKALGVLMAAAESWASELNEYIIPADDDSDEESDMDATINRRQQVDDIDEAIKLLTPKEKP